MKHFKTLYKKTSTGKIQEWGIAVVVNEIRSYSGQVSGKKIESTDIIANGKNVGKKNETTKEEQAYLEAESRWKNKKKKGYVENIEDAQNGKVSKLVEGGYEPMLAKSFDKDSKHIIFPCAAQPKLDGGRGCYDKKAIWSRTRKTIISVPHIPEALKDLGFDKLDGELFHNDINVPPTAEFKLKAGNLIMDDMDVKLLEGYSPVSDANGYACVSIKRKLYYIHRLIKRAKEGETIDHINGNKLDNRRSNLRRITMSNNIANSNKRVTNTSGYKGVHKFRDKWQAQITKDYKSIHIGYFEDLVQAAKAYDKKAFELFGNYARFNFPEDYKQPPVTFEHLMHIIRQQKTPDPDHEIVQYHVYDIPSDKPFRERMLDLKKLKGLVGKKGPIVVVPTKICKDLKELMEFTDKCLERGYEGAMARNLDGAYEYKRSKNLQKIKVMEDAEFKIIGVEEGRGKLIGHGSAFICVTKEGNEFKAKMKGKLSDLKDYLINKDSYIGKQLTVQFQGLTNRNRVPRFPIGLRVREDV